MIVKSVIFDITDGYSASALELRAIDFLLAGTSLGLVAADFIAYATTELSSMWDAENVFDSSLSLTGSSTDTQWIATSYTSQRLIVVFDSLQEFDSINYCNGHSSGGSIDNGVKNVKITTSTDAITDTTFDATVTNSTVLPIRRWGQHIETDTSEWCVAYRVYSAVTQVKSVIFDIRDNWTYSNQTAIRGIRFFDKESLVTFDFSAATCYGNYLSSYLVKNAFDRTLDCDGSMETTNTWLEDAEASMRIIIVFDDEIDFDEIKISNAHTSGTYPTRGARDVKITTSTDAITSTTYNAAVANSTVLADFERWPDHLESDVEDFQTVYKVFSSVAALEGEISLSGDCNSGIITAKTTLSGEISLSGDVYTVGDLGVNFDGMLSLSGTTSIMTRNTSILGTLNLSGTALAKNSEALSIEGNIFLSGDVNTLRTNVDVSIVGSMGLCGAMAILHTADDVTLPSHSSSRWA